MSLDPQVVEVAGSAGPVVQVVTVGVQGPAGTGLGLSSSGIVVRTGASSYVARTLASLAAALTITNADGTAGDPTFDLDADLKAVAALSTVGVAVRTASNTWATRTITGTTNRVDVTNGTGAAGDPTIDISAGYVGQTSITTLGTVTTGTWSAGIASPSTLNVSDAVFRVQDNGDATKQFALEVSGVKTATTRTWTVPNFSDTFVGLTGAQTLTNKTLSSPTINTPAVAGGSFSGGTFGGGSFDAATFTGITTFPGSSAWSAAGNLGIGAVPASTISLRVSSTLATGGTTVAAVYVDGNVPTTVTNAFYGFTATVAIPNSVFSITSAVGYSAGVGLAPWSKGASATLGNAIGFYAASGIAGLATNTYGFYSSINVATATWQFYGAGTGENYLGGGLAILSGGASALSQNSILHIGAITNHTSAATTGYVVRLNIVAPATMTAGISGYMSVLRSAAAAFTLGEIAHFDASASALGAGSTITAVVGFYARNGIAVGTNNYGFFSNIVNATTTYQLAMAGTAPSYFLSEVGIGGTGTGTGGALLTMGMATAPLNAGTDKIGITVRSVSPASITANVIGYQSFGIGTTASAYTLASLWHFNAGATTVGAGSAITSVYGFAARSAVATGTNNYGFWSDIVSASNTYQLYMAGTAASAFIGSLGIGVAPTNTSTALHLRIPSTVTAVTTNVVLNDATIPATATTVCYGFRSSMTTAASAFTLANLTHFAALGAAVGAGSTVTTAYGFFASNTMAIGGTNNYGFYTDIADAATNTFAYYGSGTAPSRFNGSLGFGVTPTNTRTVLEIRELSTMTGTIVEGVRATIVAPATALGAVYGFYGDLRTVASAFTVPIVSHFIAANSTAGAGSTITSVRMFNADNNAVAGSTSNMGFYSNIAINGTVNYQLYLGGSAISYFAAPVGVGNASPLTAGGMVVAGGTTPITAVTAINFIANQAAASTNTSRFCGFYSALQTPNTAFTCANLDHFYAVSTTKGAASTITTVRGFYAANGIATGTNNYGFYSDINTATTTYQLYMAGTADSVFISRVMFGSVTESISDATCRIHMNGATSNMLAWNTNGLGAPAFTTRSAGTKIILYPNIGAANVDYALGLEASAMWFSVSQASSSLLFKWYAGTTAVMTLSGTGVVTTTGSIVETEATIAYSASMTPNAAAGNEQIITASSGVAFAINAPTNPATGQYLEITIRNTSGGALGVATWNAVFKMTAWVQPATGFSRTIVFRYNGTNWVEKGRTSADVPN
jgi:hypothetical protein